jgi:preprotein translocase subunit SecB
MNVLDFSKKSVTDELLIKIDLNSSFSKKSTNKYIIEFNLHLLNADNEENFDLKIKAIGVFKTEETITKEFKDSDFVKINSPAIVFPYLRSFVTTIISNSGYHTVILPAFNFAKSHK